MKRINYIDNEAGLTLVELMVTMVVVVLALVGYIGATTFLQKQSEIKFEKSLAIQDANRVLEQMRDASETGNFPTNVTGTFSNGAAVAAFNGLNLTNEVVTVSYADATADPLDVTVTVTWQTVEGRNVTTALRSYVTQRATS